MFIYIHLVQSASTAISRRNSTPLPFSGGSQKTQFKPNKFAGCNFLDGSGP